MKDFLKTLKLIDTLTTELDIDKHDFLSRLKPIVDEGSTGFISESFDVFSSSKNEFKGHVGINEFKIKRRRRFFDMHLNLAIAKGKFIEDDNRLRIEAEINGLSGIMIPYYVFLILFYLIFIFGFTMAGGIDAGPDGLFLPFIIIHAAFMFGIPYFMMRRSVSRLKRELEREFYFLTK